ncbi:MAG: c-type cytochrome [Gammaproteobacteria bacterium]|nr:c-type cytochrome [Gammaproteobacteria bacterium]
MKKLRCTFLILCALAISGCDSGGAPTRTVTTLSGANVTRSADPAVLEKGRRIFGQHCARCHGAQAEGAPQWRNKEADGNYPAPPLNGSGHDWHHSRQELHDFIKNGSPPGTGNMPAWKGKLSDEDIDAVIVWFQSLWPDEVYAAWVDRHAIR